MTDGLVHIGYGNMVSASRIIAIVGPSSAPIRRIREEARDAGRLIDATNGHKARSMLMMDSGHVVISAIHAETIASRIDGGGEDD